MAKFRKLALLCTSILMSCMMAAFVGCSLFEPIDSSTGSNSQTPKAPAMRRDLRTVPARKTLRTVGIGQVKHLSIKDVKE